MEAAAAGLEEAIKTFSAVARSKNPPYPPQDIDLRAAMGRNSLAGQLTRAIEAQRTYESANAAKLAGARAKREAEMRKRQEEERKRREVEQAKKAELAEQRRRMVEESREYAKRKMEEEEARRVVQDDYESGEDGIPGEKGNKKRRIGSGMRRGKKVKRDDGIDSTDSEKDGAEGQRKKWSKSRGLGDDGEDADRPKKRKRLTKSGGASATGGKKRDTGKYKSAEMVDSDEDLDDDDMALPLQDTAVQPVRSEDEADGSAGRKSTERAKGRKQRVEYDDDEELSDLDPELFVEEERERLRMERVDDRVPIDPALRDGDVEMGDD